MVVGHAFDDSSSSGGSSFSSGRIDRIESVPLPKGSSTLPKILVQNPERAEGTDLRNSRCCFHFTKFESFIYIVGLLAITLAVGRIVVIAHYIGELHDHFPERSTYYFCGITITFSVIGLAWEIPMLAFVRTRKLVGLQHYMFAMMLLWIGSMLGGVVTGGVYKIPGLVLSMSFLADMLRLPAEMTLIHRFIKSEKLDEDSHVLAAYYKKF